jgi:hypothetical protein
MQNIFTNNKITIFLFISSLFCIFLPNQFASAANCSQFQSGGFFFDNFESVEYVNKLLVMHFKLKEPYNDGRPWRSDFQIFNDECGQGVTQNPFQKFNVTIAPGTKFFSVRFTSPTHYEIWNDETNTQESCANCSGDIYAFPDYYQISFNGLISGEAIGDSFLNSTSYHIKTDAAEPPIKTSTLPTPPNCTPFQSSGYFFNNYEYAEYVNSLLTYHFRFKTPYNDGRPWYSGIRFHDQQCNVAAETINIFGQPNTWLTPYMRYYSVRFSSPTHYDIWNDEANTKEVCPSCSVDIPTTLSDGSPYNYIAFAGIVDLGYGVFLNSTPFPIQETAPLSVPIFYQNATNTPSDPDWPSEKIGYETIRTIGQTGCALTSATMILNYYGANTVPDTGETTNPHSLNQWLLKPTIGGYIPSTGIILWDRLNSFSNKSSFYYDPQTFECTTDNLNECTGAINSDLVSYSPTIVKTLNVSNLSKPINHYIVAKGQDGDTWYINDPNKRFDANKLSDWPYLNTILGLRRFQATAAIAFSSMHITLGSPADLLVTDSQGRKTGYDPVTQTSYSEIPNSIYYSERLDNEETGELGETIKDLYIPSPENVIYNLQVIGTGTGTYNLSVNSSDANGSSTVSSFTGQIQPNLVSGYSINYTSQPGQPTIIQPTGRLLYAQNFETLNLGSLNGQDGWVTIYSNAPSPNDYFQVENTIVANGTQAVSYASSTYQNRVRDWDGIRRIIPSITNGTIQFNLRATNNSGVGAYIFAPGAPPCYLAAGENGFHYFSTQNPNGIWFTPFSIDTFYLVKISFDLSNNWCRYQLSNDNGNTWFADSGQVLPFYATSSISRITLIATGNGAYFDDVSISTISPIDTVPPTTSISLSGALGNNNWYISNVIVTLLAQDNEGGVGVFKTEYSLDNGNTWQEYTAPFMISDEGIHIIQYRSQDFIGNTESTKSQEIKIDKTPSQLQLTANPSVLWPPNHKMVKVTIGGFASDSLSGIDSVSFKVIDEYGKIQPIISNFGDVIQLEAWRNGNDLDGRLYTVFATATDKAGNQTTASATVICPHDQRK